MKALVLGVMSGTSLDGVDYALCAIRPGSILLERLWHVPFPRALRDRVRDATVGGLGSHDLAQLHHDLGRFYAGKAAAGLGGTKPQAVGLHGQTVFHRPGRLRPATLQLGEPAYLAERLRVPVVSNFRAADVAAGGEGAPLATAFHVAVFAQRGAHVCVNNLGGMSNVTSIDWRGGKGPRVLAFDTGPGNALLDLAARHFSAGKRAMDRNGAWARQGTACERLLQQWLRHPFYRKKPPKSTGREQFGEDYFNSLLDPMQEARLRPVDCLATLTELTARSLALNYQRHLARLPDRVVLCGGGAANAALVASLRRAFSRVAPVQEVVSSVTLGWPLSAVEPAAFAWLAWRRLRGQKGHFPKTTGAKRTVVLGQICSS